METVIMSWSGAHSVRSRTPNPPVHNAPRVSVPAWSVAALRSTPETCSNAVHEERKRQAMPGGGRCADGTGPWRRHVAGVCEGGSGQR